MKNRFRVIPLILGITLAACACTPSKNNNPNKLNANSTQNAYQSKLDVLRPAAYSSIENLKLAPGSYISIIGRNSGDSYWKEIESGAKQAVSDINDALGYKGDKRIKLTFSAPDIQDDVDEQINILDEELARYPIAIGIAAIDTTACQVQFELAADNGIPIVTFDSGTDYSNIAAHVATNNIEAAETAAVKLASLMENSGEVAVFVQDSLSMTAKEREKGFVDTIKTNYPDVSIVNIYHMDQLSTVAQQIADEHNAAITDENGNVTGNLLNAASLSQKDVVKHIIEKNPNLKAVYTTSLDTTQLVAGVLKDMKRDDLSFVGFDGGKEQMALLENDMIDGVIIQNPYGIGYATVVAAARHVLELGNETYIDSGYAWVTKNNMNDKKIKKMLY